MALTPQQKVKVLDQVRIHDKDTGSAEAQVALFTKEIESLAKHLKKAQQRQQFAPWPFENGGQTQTADGFFEAR